MNHLEDLPNELFYILFSYFNINELYQSFYGLNCKLNNLIDSRTDYRLYVDSNIKHDIIEKFSSNIKSIYMKENKTSFSFVPFYNSLSVLIIGSLTEKHLDELPLLVCLEYLQIKTPPDSRLTNQLTRYVANSTKLYHLSLPYWCLERGNYTFSSLHSLRIFRTHPNNQLMHLIRFIPNLQYLYIYDSYVTIYPLVDENLLNIHPYLTYFHLQLTNGFTYSQLDYYLSYTCHIKSFYISTSPCLVYSDQVGPYAVLNSIANIISKRLLNLEKFQCDIIFEIKQASEEFDIRNVDLMYHQKYLITMKSNSQVFHSIWRKNYGIN